MRFQIGDVVRIAKTSQYYEEGDESNPKDMNGVIAAINSSIRVDWDNWSSNTYYESDLKLRSRNG